MSAGPAPGGRRPRLRAAPAEGVGDHRRLRALAPATGAWVLLEPADPGAAAPLAALLVAMLLRLAPDEGAWTARLDGPADQLRYLLELAAAEGIEARAVPGGGRGAELTVAAGHPLAVTLLATPEAAGCTVVVLAGDGPAVAVAGGRRGRWALLGAGGDHAPALAVAAATGAAVEPEARPLPQPPAGPRLLPAATVVLVAAAAAAWAAAPPLSGPDPRLRIGPAPPAGEQLAAAVDGRTGELVLFGGIAISAPDADLGATWTRDAGSWRLRRPPVSPPARFGAAMADDPTLERVILFGGLRRTPAAEVVEDTWAWDGESWRRVAATRAPPPGAAARGLAYDAAARTLVLVTEGPDSARTWTWDGAGWAPHPGIATPEMRWMAAAPDGAVIAVGPPDAVNRGATWRWDGARWERLAPETEVRVEPLSALLAYDPTTRRTLLVEVEFEGAEAAEAGGTWSWDGVTWTEHHSVPTVVGAFGVTEPVVAAERPLTLLGGPQDSGAYRDSWTWDGSAWRRS